MRVESQTRTMSHQQTIAYIASSMAVELYGSEVLADGIYDHSGKVSWFMMLILKP
jgi:prephenate dehydratase